MFVRWLHWKKLPLLIKKFARTGSSLIIMHSNKERSLLFIGFFCILSFTNLFGSIADSSSQNFLVKGQALTFEDQRVSGNFRLRFFNYTNSCYLGIAYDSDYYPSWVANRNTPIPCDSVVLIIDDKGSLVIQYGGGRVLPLYSVENTTGTFAILDENGNFKLLDNERNGRVLWESFDYPTDTLLPEMKVGFNKKTGQNWTLTSWRSSSFPASGSFTFGIHPNDSKQLAIWWQGDTYWTSGPWQQEDGNFQYLDASGQIPWSQYSDFYESYTVYNFHYNTTEDEVYFSYSLRFDTIPQERIKEIPRLAITPWGQIYKVKDQSVASCFSMAYGFYTQRDYGCENRKSQGCNRSNAAFFNETGVMSTEGFKFEGSENLTLYDCFVKCWNNCSCMAFASTNGTYGTGCEIWTEVTSFIDGTHQNSVLREIYIYKNTSEYGGPFTPSSTYPSDSDDALPKWLINLIVVIGVLIAQPILFYVWYQIWTRCKAQANSKWWWLPLVLIGVLIVLPILCYVYYVCYKNWEGVERRLKRTMLRIEIGGYTVVSFLYEIVNRLRGVYKRDSEVQIFNFGSIVAATNVFSEANKLGEGGFGSVYKGTLSNGQKIAIKRLSKESRQGLVEFNNEATLIAKLQHTSLVRLLGFCDERRERILIYEYMPNKSLDFYLFDSGRKKILDWGCRFNIIQGIAQGLVYLHVYSRLTVIHRDLKVSNILLDHKMNPKISDFGMARIFELRGTEENTNRIVGTYGYMSPEYAMNGIVSTKTDVFSFGVLVLEIISGKKNYSRYHLDRPLNLIGLAWELWTQDRAIEIIDPSLLECCPSHQEVLRCVQVGLLCVQDIAAHRPEMLEVVSMLSNENLELPPPKQPAFYIIEEESKPNEPEEQPKSNNGLTISVPEPR